MEGRFDKSVQSSKQAETSLSRCQNKPHRNDNVAAGEEHLFDESFTRLGSNAESQMSNDDVTRSPSFKGRRFQANS